MAHAFITVVIPFAVQRIAGVNAVLDSLSVSDQGNRPSPAIAKRLDDIGIVHYMSITAVSPVCPATQSEDPRDRDPTESGIAHLLIEIAADGGVADVLTVLAGTLGAEIEQVLAAADIKRKSEPLEKYLYQHHWKIGAGWTAPALGQIHAGSPGMSVWRIRRERDLAEYIATLIDESRTRQDWRDSSPRQRLDRIRRDIWEEGGAQWANGDTKWAFIEEPAPCLAGDPANHWDDSGYTIRNPQAVKAFRWILNTLLWPLYVPLALLLVYFSAPEWRDGVTANALLWSLLVFGALVSVVLLAALLVFLRLKRQEAKDRVDDRVPPSDQVAELMKQENFFPGAQNHMATISRLKPGWIRRLTLRIAFIVVGSGRFVGAPGFLGKNGVIHFARWIRLPGTTQLLFFSNYDGTWESYVADFIADAPTGVTAIWSNCRGFPRAKGLFGGGAQDRDRLVQWARRQQQPTRFWYSAYPDLTTARIRNNAAIRQGLASAQSDADARDWLSLFGSAPRPAAALDLGEIPTLVFGGLSNRPFAACHIVYWNGDAKTCREWLSLVAADATYGETLPGQDTAVAVALAASGLAKLEVPGDALATFPTAFQQGMWQEWRARELGDIDKNDPGNWTWGGSDDKQRVDALVLIYADKEDALTSKSRAFLDAATGLGHRVETIPLSGKPLAKRPDGSLVLPKERFGFADGVSQPVIRGGPRKNTRAMANDLVAPGELVLGYPDDIGTIPPSPSIADWHDPKRYLPDKGPDPFRRRPEFSRYEGKTGERDLGANGTFLVVRQLDELKDAFDDWLEATYKWLLAHSDKFIVTTDGVGAVVASRAPQSAHAGADARASGAQATAATAPPKEPPPAHDAGVEPAPPYAENPDSSPVTTILARTVHYSQPVTDDDKAFVKEWIAARLVGRWRDGSSLVRNQLFPVTRQNEAAKPDNNFLFGAEDPRGLSCPFGAHIRRANPRDTRFHDTPEESSIEVAAVNRHRILRVGRAYDYIDKDSTKRAGLLFMCLNADIERQFEFIQKTWLLNRNIHGLEDEVDPIMGCGARSFTIPTPNGPVRIPIDADFVRVIGGGYFFLPGRSALRYLTRGVQPRDLSPVPGIR